MTQKILSLEQIEKLALEVLVSAGATQNNASPLAHAIMQAERDGIASHGLMYLPIYVEHLQCGKVNGSTQPSVATPKPSLVVVDAKSGFAHPAINAGLDSLINAAKTQGVAAMSIYNSYNCGVLGHHAERIASHNLFALCFTNSPASIVPVGGNVPVVGTNPFSVAAPNFESGENGAAIIIDQSASVVAKSEIVKRAKANEQVPLGWVLDKQGKPTTNASEGLQGSMAPAGGYKGVGVGLMVELFAAVLSGAELGIDAAPFSGTQGGPPNTGQFMLAIDCQTTSRGEYGKKLSRLVEAIVSQQGAHLAGANRMLARKKAQVQGVGVDETLLEKIKEL